MSYSQQALDFMAKRPKRLNILHGSVRSGKTTNTLLLAPRRILQAPKGDIIITGKTERTAYRNVIKPLQTIYGQKRVRYVKGSAEGRLGNRDFYVIGGNDEAAEGKLRGLTVAYWLADELTLNPESFVTQGLARMSPEGACADWTMNPGPPKHYVKTNYIDRESELDAKVWHFRLEHNPNLPTSYVENLKQEYGGPGTLYYQRYIEGKWVLAEGTIYEMFNEAVHVASRLPLAPPDHLDLSGDYGTSNATSIGLYASWDEPLTEPGFEGLKSLRIGGYYHDGRKDGQRTDLQHVQGAYPILEALAQMVSRKPSNTLANLIRYLILDPSAASFKAEWRQKGFNVKDADHDVIEGIRTQAKMLSAGEYMLGPDPSNRPVIDEYGAYVWDKKAQERGEDKPLKQNDHCFPAGTLVSTARGQTPIEEVTTHDHVLTRDGYKQVLRSGMTKRDAEIMEVCFSDGNILRATPNHPVFVQGKGFIRMDELRYEDAIISVWDAKNLLPLTAKNTTATPMLTTLATGFISEQAGGVGIYTDTFTKMLTGVSQKVLRYTTKTGTQITTPLITSSFYPTPSTKLCTALNERLRESIKRRCLKLLLNGMEAQRGESGTRSRGRKSGKTLNLFKRFVSSAARFMKPSRGGMLISSVQPSAEQQRDAHRERMTKLESARYVDLSLELASTSKPKLAHVSVEPRWVGKSDVYNLSVAELPEFFANGVLVHNCKDEERYFLLTMYPSTPTYTRPPKPNSVQRRTAR